MNDNHIIMLRGHLSAQCCIFSVTYYSLYEWTVSRGLYVVIRAYDSYGGGGRPRRAQPCQAPAEQAHQVAALGCGPQN